MQDTSTPAPMSLPVSGILRYIVQPYEYIAVHLERVVPLLFQAWQSNPRVDCPSKEYIDANLVLFGQWMHYDFHDYMRSMENYIKIQSLHHGLEYYREAAFLFFMKMKEEGMISPYNKGQGSFPFYLEQLANTTAYFMVDKPCMNDCLSDREKSLYLPQHL